MMKYSLTIFLLTALPNVAADRNARTLQIRGLSYESQVNERTSTYVTPGSSSTNCNGTGTTVGNTTTANANCQTTSTPPQVHTINARTIDVTNFVEAEGQRYKISCRASWVGSNCGPLIQGDVFTATIDGHTMWVSARKGGTKAKK
jgi:hypothetical protein